MIFRALECTVIGSNDPPATVWFQAYDGEKPGQKIVRLLALAWDVKIEDVCVGSVDSELDLEKQAFLPAFTRGARWFEAGLSHGVPIFDMDDQVVMLDGANRQRLAEASKAAALAARIARMFLTGDVARVAPAAREGMEQHIAALNAFVARAEAGAAS